MQFIENGIDIPDELMELQKQGKVVFFCGAGVSVPAKLPGFYKLTKQVMDNFGVSQFNYISKSVDGEQKTFDEVIEKIHNEYIKLLKEKDINLSSHNEIATKVLNDLGLKGEAFVRTGLREGNLSFDQVFTELYDLYERKEVDKQVTKILTPFKEPYLDAHKSILTLSQNEFKQPFVITTNFDHLFELADPILSDNYWELHNTPNLRYDPSPSGVVYIHGRLQNNLSDVKDKQLILSSTDFAHAYLVDGWATRFIRQILEQRIIILIGYSANDPLVRYLLDGLNHDVTLQKKMYAFVASDDIGSIDRWRHLKITPLIYKNDTKDHQALWDNLSLWANSVKDHDLWIEEHIKLAQEQLPRDLTPFKRGEIVSLLKSKQGKRYFNKANPPPSAEWLCVFDTSIRTCKQENYLSFCDVKLIDTFGLNNEPIDKKFVVELKEIKEWLSKIISQPTTFWWALKTKNLTTELLDIIKELVKESPNITDSTKCLWLYFFDNSDKELNKDIIISELYKLRRTANIDQWSLLTLNYLEKIISPIICLSSSLEYNLPPINSATSEFYDSIYVAKLEFNKDLRSSIQLNIPESASYLVLIALINNFNKILILLQHPIISRQLMSRPKIRPKQVRVTHISNIGETNELSFLFDWTSELLLKFATQQPMEAKKVINNFPCSDHYFFDLFKILIWLKTSLYNEKEIAEGILQLSHQVFWENDYNPILLPMLVNTWPKILGKDQELIEQLILRGVERPEGVSDEKYNRVNDYNIGSRLGYLEKQGCVLSKEATDKLNGIRQQPWWEEKIEEDIAELEAPPSFAKLFEYNTDPTELQKLPKEEIILKAIELNEKSPRDKPFEGLVKIDPYLALDAIKASPDSCDITTYWKTLLNKTENNKDPEWLLYLLSCLVEIPKEKGQFLSKDISKWIYNYCLFLKEHNKYWELFNYIFELLQFPTEDIDDSLDYIFKSLIEIDKQALLKDADWKLFNQCINKVLESKKPVSEELAERIGSYLQCLYNKNTNWVKNFYLPLLDYRHSLAYHAWLGVISDQNFSPELFNLIKDDFIYFFINQKDRLKRKLPDKDIAPWTVKYSYWDREDTAFFSNQQCREILRLISDKEFNPMFDYISRVLDIPNEGWQSKLQCFFDNIWPKELYKQTAKTTETILHLLEMNQQYFVEIVSIVLSYLRPTNYNNALIIYNNMAEHEIEVLIKKSPDLWLEFLDKTTPDDPTNRTKRHIEMCLDKIIQCKKELKESPIYHRLLNIG